MTISSTSVPAVRVCDPTGLIRLGILALPLGNALKLLGNLGTFDSIGYGIPAATEAATAAGPGFFLGELVGSIAPTLLSLFGVFALFGYLTVRLTARAERRTLVTALTCSILGAGLTLAALGVINYAVPALAHAYQAGDARAMVIANSFFTWPWGAVLYPAVLFPIGIILFCITLWRSTSISHIAIVLTAVSGILIAIPAPLHSLRLAGGVIGLLATGWLTLAIRHDLTTGPPITAPTSPKQADHR
ncbi:MAG TPA: hypothetical protein VG317_11115 [Pseudonocardiaceae bacterium]|jgi:hypothetical protein|nr:hypothetical protein [Pseudonocardiaceae bacterium]